MSNVSDYNNIIESVPEKSRGNNVIIAVNKWCSGQRDGSSLANRRFVSRACPCNRSLCLGNSLLGGQGWYETRAIKWVHKVSTVVM